MKAESRALFMYALMCAIFLSITASCGYEAETNPIDPGKTPGETPGNVSPVITELIASVVNPHPGNIVSITVNANDPDGDALSYSYEFSAGSGTISGSGNKVTAVIDTIGVNTVKVTVTDGKGGRATQTLDLTGTNNSPSIASFAAAAGILYNTGSDIKTLAASASDADGDALTYSYSVVSGKGTVSGSADTAVFTSGTSGGISTVRVTVSDPYGGEASADAQIRVCGWKELASASGMAPTGRSGHSAVSDDAGNMIVFGGNDSSIKNDLWKYDIKNEAWTDITPASSPPVRMFHSAIYNGKLVIFGGYAATGSSFKDAWSYDPANQSWTQLPSYPGTMGPMNHSAIFNGTDMITYGGLVFGSGGPNYNVYKYTVSAVTPAWTLLTAAAKGPVRRMDHSAIYDGGGNMIIFGGSTTTGAATTFLNDVWRYNITGKTWTQLASVPGPAVRSSHTAIYDGNGSMVIFAGSEGTSNYKNDVWRYDLANQSWTALTSVHGPSGRSEHSAIFDGGGNMIIYGGATGTSLSDLWMYVLP